MGEQRIQEVIMIALTFLLLGILFLLIAAGRIWIDATPVNGPTVDSAEAHNPSESVTPTPISESKDSVA